MYRNIMNIECNFYEVKAGLSFVQIQCNLDWLQSLKQFFINVPYHILVASLTLMALRTIRVRLATSKSHQSKTSYKYMIWHIYEKLF